MNIARDTALLLPEIIRETLSHLEKKNLLNAMLVNSTWAQIGYEFKWRAPPPAAFWALTGDIAHRRARFVRELEVWDSDMLRNLGKFKFVCLETLRTTELNTSRLDPIRPTDLQPFLGAGLKHLELSFDAQPVQLFEMLHQYCFSLCHLHLELGEPYYQCMAEANEDLKYLPPLIEQCDRLIIVSLLLDIYFDRDIKASHSCFVALARSTLRYMMLPWVLPEGFSRAILTLVPRPFLYLEHLTLTSVPAADLADLLRHMTSIKVLDIVLNSEILGELFPAMAACTHLRCAEVDLSSITAPILHRDVIALKIAVNLVTLELTHRRGHSGPHLFGNQDIIDTMVLLTNLEQLTWDINDNTLSSEQLLTLGAALRRLRLFKAPFELNIADLKDVTTAPLFPKLEELNIKEVLVPSSGALREDLATPTIADRRQWSRYLDTLAQIAVPLFFKHMPKLRHFSPTGRFVRRQREAVFIQDLDITAAWDSIFGMVMCHAIKIANVAVHIEREEFTESQDLDYSNHAYESA